MKDLVTVDWLALHIDEPDAVVLDASISETASGKALKQDDATIPTARKLDIKGLLVDEASPFPNTVPSPVQFETVVRNLGINQHSKIVIFDKMGIYSSPRAWWLFKLMGHQHVAVLDGGLPEWRRKSLPITQISTRKYNEGNFRSQVNDHLIIRYKDVLQNIEKKAFEIVDARSKQRFEGVAPEPRKRLRSGSIPRSSNIHFNDVLVDGKFRSENELRNLLKTKGLDKKQLVYSCGSGMTACIVMLAFHICEEKGLRLYDGSWTEWAQLQGLFTLE